MNIKDVITRLCALATHVASERFGHQIPADCICGDQDSNFQFSPEVLDFMETAVKKALTD